MTVLGEIESAHNVNGMVACSDLIYIIIPHLALNDPDCVEVPDSGNRIVKGSSFVFEMRE